MEGEEGGAKFVSYLKRGVSFESRPSAAGSNRLPISFAKVRMLECTECPNSRGGKFALNKANLFHINPYALCALKTLFGSSLSGNKHWGHIKAKVGASPYQQSAVCKET